MTAVDGGRLSARLVCRFMGKNCSACWCFLCYGVNDRPRGACQHCGHPIEEPAGLSIEQRLIWTLRHPDGDRAVLAARALGTRRAREAVPRLRQLVTEGRDPYLGAEALRALIAIEGTAGLGVWLEQLAASGPVMVRRVAHEALDRFGGPY